MADDAKHEIDETPPTPGADQGPQDDEATEAFVDLEPVDAEEE